MSDDTEAEQHKQSLTICLIGAGTIGLSFAALHLVSNPSTRITIHDPRPDLEEHISTNLPSYVSSIAPSNTSTESYQSRVTVTTDLVEAVQSADIIQESGPENLDFKQHLWTQVLEHTSATVLLWSSTSGIPASAQSSALSQKNRVLVVHPYNPPHMMPLIEIVPAPETDEKVIERTVAYWKSIGRSPVVIDKEVTGFVANRLAFALFREAIALVREGVVGVEEIDAIVENSMGPRWAVAGPFKSYHAGGGQGGLEAFMKNIGGTVRDCWKASEEIKVGSGGIEDGWEDKICEDAEKAYGRVDTKQRDRITKDVLAAVKEGKETTNP